MNILKFKFEDTSLDLKLEEIKLNKFNLLVGASGVGKTQILRYILNLKDVVNGRSLNGIYWFIEFETLDGYKYTWEGEFEKKDSELFSLDFNTKQEYRKNKSKIIFEKIFLNDKLIVYRDPSIIIFNDTETVRLPQTESAMSLLKEEALIEKAHKSLNMVNFMDYSESVSEPNKISINVSLYINSLLDKYKSLSEIQESDLDIQLKLFLIYKNDKKIFSLIKKRFCDIFTQVEDIKIEPIDIKIPLPDFLREQPFIHIKERNVKHWIEQFKISSGMFRTLIQLSELYLCQEGSVFLIDEFENSLGINCINEITSDILSSNRKIQFILTSHHPYIIDSIGFENWKLVTRNAGVIKTHNMDKFNIGKSKHSAFMQLLQLEEYQTGQEQE